MAQIRIAARASTPEASQSLANNPSKHVKSHNNHHVLVNSHSQAAFQSLYSRPSTSINTRIFPAVRPLVRTAITGIVFTVVAVAIASVSARGRATIIMASVIQRKHGTWKQDADKKERKGAIASG